MLQCSNKNVHQQLLQSMATFVNARITCAMLCLCELTWRGTVRLTASLITKLSMYSIILRDEGSTRLIVAPSAMRTPSPLVTRTLSLKIIRPGMCKQNCYMLLLCIPYL